MCGPCVLTCASHCNSLAFVRDRAQSVLANYGPVVPPPPCCCSLTPDAKMLWLAVVVLAAHDSEPPFIPTGWCVCGHIRAEARPAGVSQLGGNRGHGFCSGRGEPLITAAMVLSLLQSRLRSDSALRQIAALESNVLIYICAGVLCLGTWLLPLRHLYKMTIKSLQPM